MDSLVASLVAFVMFIVLALAWVLGCDVQYNAIFSSIGAVVYECSSVHLWSRDGSRPEHRPRRRSYKLLEFARGTLLGFQVVWRFCSLNSEAVRFCTGTGFQKQPAVRRQRV